MQKPPNALSHISAVEQRFSERSPERERQIRSLARGDYTGANGAQRVEMRLERLGARHEAAAGVATRAMVAANVTASAKTDTTAVGLERVLGTNDLISASFLEKGLRAAMAVARVNLGANAGRQEGYGTGFLVSDRLLLTNNHVLENESVANGALAEFNYQEVYDGTIAKSILFRFAPQEFFLTDKHLDYSLVAVNPVAQDGTPLARFGWLPLIETLGKAMIGEWVNIIQHPGGEIKQLALRENQIVDLLEQFLHYKTDTAPGSSGSPVFNDQWEVVALHHSGVPERNEHGQLLTADGRIWYPALGEHRIHWIANEGVRTSRVVASIKQAALNSDAEKQLRDGLFVEPPSWELEAICPIPNPAGFERATPSAIPSPDASHIKSWGGAMK